MKQCNMMWSGVYIKNSVDFLCITVTYHNRFPNFMGMFDGTKNCVKMILDNHVVQLFVSLLSHDSLITNFIVFETLFGLYSVRNGLKGWKVVDSCGFSINS